MWVAGCTAKEAIKPIDADTQTALTIVTSVLTVARTVEAATGGDDQRTEGSIGEVGAAGVATTEASHVPAAVPAATVVIFREEAPGGCPVEMLVASAKDAIAEAAEAKVAGAPRIAAPGSTAAMAVFGSSAVTPGRTAQGDTNEMRSAP